MKVTTKAACRGCHGGCMYLLTVEDGKLVSAVPDPEGPLNRGRGCPKGRSVIEQVYHPGRLTAPLRRVGARGEDKWEVISWEEAYRDITEKMGGLMREYGPESVAIISGTGRHHLAQFWRFGNVLGTPNAASSGALICLGPRKNAGELTAGHFAGVDYYGDVKPAGILVWGANPAVSGADGELQWHIKDAVKAGTPLIVVDPQPTELAKKAALWLRVRPGTDGALALAILNVLFEEDLYDHDFCDNWCHGLEELKERCREYPPEKAAEITWVPAEDIRRAARMIAAIKPLSMEWGCAIEQSTNSFQTCRAIFMIPAVTGNYDIPGGFVESQEIAPTEYPMFERLSPEAAKKGIFGGYPQIDGRMSPKLFAHPWLLLDAIKTEQPYKVRGLFSNANNTLLSVPDSRHSRECLEQLDYFVYMDFFMTPTAQMADLVLPAALWPEVDSLFCMPEFGDEAILAMRKVIQVGQCKSDQDFMRELCAHMGLDYGAHSQEQLLDESLFIMGQRRPEYEGLNWDKFKDMGAIEPERKYYNYRTRGHFDTPTGKFELWSTITEKAGGDPLPNWTEVPESPVSRPDLAEEYPLVLTTGSRIQQYFISNNRQVRSLRRQAPFPIMTIHPDTAAAAGIREGDWVWIENQRGRVTQKAHLQAGNDPRVVNAQMGWWYPEAGAPDYDWDLSNINVLTAGAAPCDPVNGAYQLRALLCRVYPNPEGKAIEERYYSSDLYFELPVDHSSPSLVMDPNRCVFCGECIRVCRDVQGVDALSIGVEGGLTRLMARGGQLKDSGCVGCGQCAAVCPTGAIRVKSDTQRVREALADPNTFVVGQVAPSVRVGVGGQPGFPAGADSMEKLVGALKALGFDRVYDTVFGADLTAVEEAAEFTERLAGKGELPLLTSCCPAWVKFCEERHPDFASNLSTCRSPQQMLGAVIRAHHEDPDSRDGKQLMVVSVMPCTAKKGEILRRESVTGGVRDVDVSITTGELLELLKEAGLTPETCSPCPADRPFAGGSGGGTLFGVTGGVTQAVLRQLGVENPVWTETDGVLRADVEAAGRRVSIAVVSGLDRASALLDRVRTGEEKPDLIEVMACPGGCVMGGGQPSEEEVLGRNRNERSAGLRKTDEGSAVKRPGDSEGLKAVWDTLIAGREHKLLHRNFSGE